MDYFFNQRTQVLAGLDDRKRQLLRSIYNDTAYASVLPKPRGPEPAATALRQHPRFSIRCPAQLSVQSYGTQLAYPLQVIDLSLHGFQAECAVNLPEGTHGQVEIELGEHEIAHVGATAVRRHEAAGTIFYGFMVPEPDATLRRCVEALLSGRTHADLKPRNSALAMA
jgi:hypothetical protein